MVYQNKGTNAFPLNQLFYIGLNWRIQRRLKPSEKCTILSLAVFPKLRVWTQSNCKEPVKFFHFCLLFYSLMLSSHAYYAFEVNLLFCESFIMRS